MIFIKVVKKAGDHISDKIEGVYYLFFWQCIIKPPKKFILHDLTRSSKLIFKKNHMKNFKFVVDSWFLVKKIKTTKFIWVTILFI